jgi:hypothetical protein
MKTLRTLLGALATFVVVFGAAMAAYAADWRGQPAASDPAVNARLPASCQNQLKQMGLVFKMFANESKGEVCPALSPEAGKFMFSNESKAYPEYLTDMSVLMCPADNDIALLEDPEKKANPVSLIDDHSYFHLGYVIRNEEDLKAFAAAYKERIAKGLALTCQRLLG